MIELKSAVDATVRCIEESIAAIKTGHVPIVVREDSSLINRDLLSLMVHCYPCALTMTGTNWGRRASFFKIE
jgi:hypothetical protein